MPKISYTFSSHLKILRLHTHTHHDTHTHTPPDLTAYSRLLACLQHVTKNSFNFPAHTMLLKTTATSYQKWNCKETFWNHTRHTLSTLQFHIGLKQNYNISVYQKPTLYWAYTTLKLVSTLVHDSVNFLKFKN